MAGLSVLAGIQGLERRLAAILSADVKGYSAMMASNEDATHSRVTAAVKQFIRQIERFGGKVFTLAGDGVLAEFPSAVNALRFAVSMQAELAQVAPPGERAGGHAAGPRIEFRIGINVGDVLVHDGALGGDSVNVAARLEQVAPPGGICISRGVYEQVHRVLDLSYHPMGTVDLKNIRTPVEVFQVAQRMVQPPVRERHAPEPVAAPDGALSIAVLGGTAVRFRGRELALRSRKARAVLAYLALNESRRETRERLVGLLWSEVAEDRARASLRQVLHELREALEAAGCQGLVSTRDSLQFDHRLLRVDVGEVVRLAERFEAHELLLRPARVADSLLRDLDDVDPAFGDWVQARRQALHDHILRHLEDGLAARAADPRAARRLAEAILCQDPTHEEACRRLMRARAEEGDVPGALRAYDALWRVLDQDYDMEPSAATQALVAEIKLGQIEIRTVRPFPAAKPAGEEAPRATRSPRIALLVEPFSMYRVDPDRAHLVEGFRLDLIACLVRFREWFVIERGTAAARQHGTPDLPHYQVAAMAYQSGDSISLVLTLQALDANIYVWSERFALTLDAWFEMQQRIVRRIATSLNVQLSAERLARLAGEPDVSLQVYDKWLRGQSMTDTFSAGTWTRAAQIFNDAIRDAPGFSLGYSSLAEMNNTVHIVHPGIFRDADKAEATLQLARKAVALDPLDSRAQLCLGWSYAMARRYAQAAVHMDLACGLNANDPWATISVALFYAFYGDAERAVDLAGQSMGMLLVPSTTYWAYQVSILFMAGDYEGVIEAADQAQDVIRTLPAWRAAAQFHLGRTTAAAEEAKRFVSEIRNNWFGAMPASDEAIARWLLHLYPISQAEHWERLRTGVAGAGLPAAGLRHHAW